MSFGGSGNSGPKRELTRIPSTGSNLAGRGLKRTASLSNASAKRPKLGVADLGSGVRLGEEAQGKKGLFKVPQLPLVNGKSKGKEKAKPADESDVFGGTDMVIDGLNRKAQSESKAKRKRNINDGGTGDNDMVMEIERANKNVCVLDCLIRLSPLTLQF